MKRPSKRMMPLPKGYQQGGPVATPTVTTPLSPRVETGIPQGGFAKPAIDRYLAGTHPYKLSYSPRKNIWTSTRTFAPILADPIDTPDLVEDNDTAVVDTLPANWDQTTDSAGVPAPYLGVDPYDLEGDDNFLTQDEYQQQVDIISDDLGIDYDPTKTFESQLSPEAYAEFQDASLGESPAQTAADTIYNQNQQIYGEPTGNLVTSLVTGDVTNTPITVQDNIAAGLDSKGLSTPLSDAALGVVRDENRATTEGTTALEHAINRETQDYQDAVASGAVPAFDINDPSTWVGAEPLPNVDSSPSIVDTATGIVSGGGDDGVGNFGAVGDFFGGIGDALGITDYAGEAEAAAQAEAEAAAAAQAEEAARAAEAQRLAEQQAEAARAAEAERQRQAAAAAEAERQRIAAQVAAQQEAARIAAEQEAARVAAEQEAARVAAEQEAARIAAEEAAAAEEVVAAPLTGGVDWGSEKVLDAQDRLAAGEIDFVTYLQEAGLQDVYTGSLGINPIGPSTVSDTGYVDAGGGPVHTTTGQHTVENEMDGATAAENYQNIKNSRNDDDPHMTHDEIIEYHKSLEKAETDLIQSDLSDDEFWDAYDDDDDGGGGGSNDGGATVICTALKDLGYINARTHQLADRWAIFNTDAQTMQGYLTWATPIANSMRAGNRLTLFIFVFLGMAWAYQMAHEVTNGREGKRSITGWLCCRIGLLISKLVGGLDAKQKCTT